MPPPKDKPNPLAAPGDDFTSTLRSDVYPAIDSKNANLHSKSVFIVGASKGIGRALAVSYAQAGTSNIAIGARSDLSATEGAIHDAAKASKKPAPKVLQVRLDVASQSSVQAAAAEIEKSFGGLDILVHNSGAFHPPAPIVDSDPDAWWNTWDINVRGPYLVTRAFLPLLLKGGDKIIIYMSSVGAWSTGPGLSAYQPSKLALLRFAEFVSVEYGEQGVVAFCVHPGNIPGTDILGPGGVPEELRHVFTETVELPGNTVVWLTKERREWLGGRYVSCTWDVEELLGKREEIVKGDKLKAGMRL
ncbi:hypothetical protein P7C71_g367, partial [Lecanoromycetidae sp. Uapishka_2]